MTNTQIRLLAFIDKKISQGVEIIVIGRNVHLRDFPDSVHRLESLNKDPENIIERVCGANRRILHPNIKETEINNLDALESHCSGAVIENSSNWIKRHPLYSKTNESYQLISKAKCFVAYLYEDDIYESIDSIKLKWGGSIVEDFFVTTGSELAHNAGNTILAKNQTVIIYLSAY